MRYLYLLAGFLSLLVGIDHAVMRGINTLNPLMASTLAMEVRVAMMAVWHAISALFIVSTLAFFWAFRADRPIARPIGFLLGSFYVLFAGLIAILSFIWFEDLMVLPQWTLLAPIGIFAIIASL